MSTDNLNYLSGNRAVLTIPGLTDTNYTLQNFPLPSISLPSADTDSPFAVEHYMGDKVEYAPLDVKFIVNENLTNWLEIHNWIRGLGAPLDKQEFVNKPLTYVDSIVTIYSSHNNPILAFKFLECVPIFLEGIEFSESIPETEIRTCSLVLKYQRYDIKRLA